MTATDVLSPRDYCDIGFGVGYEGRTLADALRGLGVAFGQAMTAGDRRALLDGYNHGVYCRDLDMMSQNDGPPQTDDDGPIPW